MEERTRRLQEALSFYNEAAPLVERSEDHALKGSFHFKYGLVWRRLSAPENREDYLDRALIEYAASSFHYQQAGNTFSLIRLFLDKIICARASSHANGEAGCEFVNA
jgi:hypothetical protein